MMQIRKLVFVVGAAFCLSASGFSADAQVDVRFTELPNYQSNPCAKGKGKNLNYRKPPSNADAGYKALFGVWCAVNENNSEFLLAFSHNGDAFPGKTAHTIRANVATNKGLEEGFGVAFFDNRQKRWSIAMGRANAWVFWPEANGRLGQARGNYSGKKVRLHKGKKQTWVLLRRVK